MRFKSIIRVHKPSREACHALRRSGRDLSETTIYLEPHFKLQRSLSRKLNVTSVVAYFPNSIWCIQFIKYSFKSWQTLQESEGTYNPSAQRWSNWYSSFLTELRQCTSNTSKSKVSSRRKLTLSSYKKRTIIVKLINPR